MEEEIFPPGCTAGELLRNNYSSVMASAVSPSSSCLSQLRGGARQCAFPTRTQETVLDTKSLVDSYKIHKSLKKSNLFFCNSTKGPCFALSCIQALWKLISLPCCPELFLLKKKRKVESNESLEFLNRSNFRFIQNVDVYFIVTFCWGFFFLFACLKNTTTFCRHQAWKTSMPPRRLLLTKWVTRKRML